MTESQLTFVAAFSSLLFALFPIFGDVTDAVNETHPEAIESMTSDYYVTSLIPTELPNLVLNHLEPVQFSISSRRTWNSGSRPNSSTALTLACLRGSWSVVVRSLDPQIALPVLHLHQDLQRSNRKFTADLGDALSDSVVVNDSRGYFGVLGRRLGRCLLVIETSPYPYPATGWCPVLYGSLRRQDYHVTVVRARRSVDVGFNWAVALTTVVNGFSLGCVTEWRVVKECARRPWLMLVAATLQLVAMPVVALALVRLLFLGHDLGMGLLCVACLPGGGMAYVIAALANRKERSVDAALSFISVYASTVTFPLWIYLIDRSTSTPHPSSSFTLLQLTLSCSWLAIHAAFHQTGVQLRLRLSAHHVDPILNWLTKPFLLLYAILLTTLGVYINAYTFALLSWSLLAALSLLPTTGFLLGTALGWLTGQKLDVVRVLAAETSTLNSVLAITVLRFALDAPESDIMVTVPFWLAFTSPIPVLVELLLRSVAGAFRVGATVGEEREEEGLEGVLGRTSDGSSQGDGGTMTESCVSPLQLTPVDEANQEELLIVKEKITVL